MYVELIINQYTLFEGITMTGCVQPNGSPFQSSQSEAAGRCARVVSAIRLQITRCGALKITCITINTNIQ